MSGQDIEDITNSMNYVYVDDTMVSEIEDNSQKCMILYIQQQTHIEEHIKDLVISLIENDNYNSYLDIYNICMDNNIELPPFD